ncbi:RNA polymerase sigma factor [Caulobacter segnis]|uniref:RNA polymerase sigma factor n=1 Tax=Caulobacter segnis TaxID=88688 RepID=UPI00285994D2|nr:RNA polymerase sigma factor [Caulobacter segnis]MDR6624477.1 RNA polymerase sigma-70 factor (ECF subfamily) [Caulobacter segnis]
MNRKLPRAATQPEGDWDDRDDLDRTYRRDAPWLKASLRRWFGPRIEADAEDLVQEAYLRLAQARPAQIAEPRALLTRVAANLAKDLLRRRAVRAQHAQRVHGEAKDPQIAASALDILLAKEAILSLPEAYLEVFVLRRFHGLTYEEIATRCGLTVKGVEWRLARAVEHALAAQAGLSGRSDT